MGVLDQDLKSDVKEIAELRRGELMARNKYRIGSVYNESSPDALSDGDRLGRGDSGSGEIGTSEDIESRKRQLAKNAYTKGRKYKVSD